MPEAPQEDPSVLVARLYDEHGPALFRYAAVLLGDAAAAEDAIHQVFTALLGPGVRSIDNHLHYLRRAVRNECYSMLRRRLAARRAEVRLEPIQEFGSDPDTAQRLAVERALARLPAEQREVIHLHIFEGLAFREIASATASSINTVAGRYRYALNRLREVLTK